MANKNTSDSIEAYIKALLAQAGMAELKRSELADVFQVVPSQINYVIKTRFTESRGYIVESKRGGGGYIRIGKVQFSDHHQMLQDLAANIGETISQQVFNDILQMLYEEKLLTRRETQLLLATTSDEVLGRDALILRATMLKKIIQQVSINKSRAPLVSIWKKIMLIYNSTIHPKVKSIRWCSIRNTDSMIRF